MDRLMDDPGVSICQVLPPTVNLSNLPRRSACTWCQEFRESAVLLTEAAPEPEKQYIHYVLYRMKIL